MTQKTIQIQRRLDLPGMTLLITAAAYFLFIVLRLAFNGFDPSFFIVVGDKFYNSDLAPDNLQVIENSSGYDGQFYYRIALDPFTSQTTDFGIRLDSPPRRQQRILYPFMVWAFSLGNKDFVPLFMILINFGALCCIGWIGGAYAQAMKRHALWGLLFSLFPGFVLSLARDLTEILEICLLMAGLLLIRKDKPLFAAICLALAVLTKETALLASVAILFPCFLPRVKSDGVNTANRYLFGIPVLTYCIWQCLLFLQWGQFPIMSGNNPIGPPFVGLINFIKTNLALSNLSQVFFLGEFLFIVGFVICVVYTYRFTTAWRHEKNAWILYGVLMTILTDAVWLEDWGFLRALCDFYTFGAAIILSSETNIRIPVIWASICLWLALFSFRIFLV